MHKPLALKCTNLYFPFMTSNDNAVAMEILKQLGGNMFRMMTGMHSMTFDSKSLTFKLPASLAKKFNVMTITLAGDDTYTVETYKMRGARVTVLEPITGLHCNQLRSTFSQLSGLATSL